MKFVSKSLNNTQEFAEKFLTKLESNKNGAKVLLLEGDLGSGKTTFTQALARELGVKNNLTSPTFVLMKKYDVKNSNFKYLIHIDAYRLNSGHDLVSLGWEEFVSNPSNLIVVEWPELVSDLWDGSELKLKFKFIDEETREIEWLEKTTKEN